MSNMNLNCFGSFDGLHNLILGKFRFGLSLKKSKSVCGNEMVLDNNDEEMNREIYLPSRSVSHNDLTTACNFETKRLCRTVSHRDLAMAIENLSNDGKAVDEETHDEDKFAGSLCQE